MVIFPISNLIFSKVDLSSESNLIDLLLQPSRRMSWGIYPNLSHHHHWYDYQQLQSSGNHSCSVPEVVSRMKRWRIVQVELLGVYSIYSSFFVAMSCFLWWDLVMLIYLVIRNCSRFVENFFIRNNYVCSCSVHVTEEILWNKSSNFQF